MTQQEVEQLIGPPTEPRLSGNKLSTDAYLQGPDWLGNRRMILVTFDENNRVKSWYVEKLPRQIPR
jgi:hypothetical protein